MFARLWRLVDAGSPTLLVAAAAVPLAVAATLVPLRNQAGDATVAMLLIVVVLSMALLGGRAPSMVAAVVGGLALNVLHTTPYYTLHMDDPQQVEILLVFLVVALMAGELGHEAIHDHQLIRAAEYREARAHRVLAVAAGGASDAELIETVVREIADECGARAQYVDRAKAPEASVDAEGQLRDHHGHLLQPESTTSYRLDVAHGRHRFGSVAVDGAHGGDRHQRREARALAQLLAVALAARAATSAPSDT